jgi:predicted ATP-grasp superfamily ATP-dependent carboligase
VDGEQPFVIYQKPELKSSSLIVGWSEDAGNLGTRVIDYLIDKLGTIEFGEIEPPDFFPLSGVSVQDDTAQFPGSRFFYCAEKNLVIFRSNPPRTEWYRFLNAILDVAEHYCHANEVFTIGGMVFMGAHTVTRNILALYNSTEIKTALGQYSLGGDIDYESPPGQRPTLNSYLLWVAGRRNIGAASLWVPVPFYLSSTEDPQSCRKILEFFDRRFNLDIDFSDIDGDVVEHDEKMTRLRSRSPEVDNHISKLESNFGLTQEESEELAREVEGFLK